MTRVYEYEKKVHDFIKMERVLILYLCGKQVYKIVNYFNHDKEIIMQYETLHVMHSGLIEC